MDFKKVISYRVIWMAIAILWIVYYHSYIETANKVLYILKNVGYIGVDIFIFASGIGNYYSYLRDKNPLEFIKRKIKRLAFPYVPIILIWCIYNIVFYQTNPIYILGNIFGIQGLSSAGTYLNWFITCIVVLYLVTPYLASFVSKNNNKNIIILLVVLILISTAFYGDDKMIIIFTRFPIYVIGMWFAKNDQTVITKKVIFIGLALVVVGTLLLVFFKLYYSEYMWSYGLHWYPLILVVPFMCCLISFVSNLMDRNKVGKRILQILKIIGNCTFEIFLVQITLFEYCCKYFSLNNLEMNNIVWIVIIIATIMLSIIYKRIIIIIQNKVLKETK